MNPVRGKRLLNIILFCKGQPLKRPRLGRKNIYQPKDNQVEIYNELQAYAAMMGLNSIEEPVVIDMTFMFSRGNKKFNHYQGEYPIAPVFGDEDNLRKSINDALVHTAILKDDRYVIGGETYKIFSKEDKIKIKIWSIKCKNKST